MLFAKANCVNKENTNLERNWPAQPSLQMYIRHVPNMIKQQLWNGRCLHSLQWNFRWNISVLLQITTYSVYRKTLWRKINTLTLQLVFIYILFTIMNLQYHFTFFEIGFQIVKCSILNSLNVNMTFIVFMWKLRRVIISSTSTDTGIFCTFWSSFFRWLKTTIL